MSRSYKHMPIWKQVRKGMKCIANKHVRKQKYIGNNSYYKKIYSSYDICDYVSYYSLYEFKKNFYKNFLTTDVWYTADSIIRYKKFYYWK